MIDYIAAHTHMEAAKARDARDLAAIDGEIGWDKGWLARHCMASGPVRMTTSEASDSASGACPLAVSRQGSGQGPEAGERLWLIDANSVIHRLYHALPPTSAPKTGVAINAVIGWLRWLRTLRRHHQVKYILPVFDGAGAGWRTEIYPGYKAGRPEQDEELRGQWTRVQELTEALRLAWVQVPRVEADDLIAAYTEAAVARGCEVFILSTDKDLQQLVRGEDLGPGSVRLFPRPRRELELVGPPEVEAKFGVQPQALGDLLALAGDSVDSIPGVRGVGVKTAAKLLSEHRGDLEGVLSRWSLIPGSMSATIRDGREVARMSRRLVALDDATPLPIPLGELRPWVPHRGELNAYFARLGFPRFEAAVDAYEGPDRGR